MLGLLESDPKWSLAGVTATAMRVRVLTAVTTTRD
jgi:hypothetical protein